MIKWLEGLAPDVVTTGRRFSFAIILAAVMTALGIAAANEAGPLSSDDWLLWIAGFGTAAVCAVAGVLFGEDRPDRRAAALVLTYALPVVIVAVFQARDYGWLFPGTLPVAALLWLSVSPATRIGRGETREDQQNRFWWMNSQAIATAVVAAAGFVIIFVGILAIERSLAVLFGVEAESIFYRWVLPFVGLFLTPVYWLSTLPRPAEFRAPAVEKPEFVGTTVGFLGQFVLVPLLLIYAAILLAYTVQIVVTQSLPQGTIGWMVLGFVVTGAAAWLVLHPPFMRTRGMVRLFRRWWFWLTLIPLALFAVAVFVRVDAYGLTTERVLLIAGGIWATVLALVFLIGRGDIRLIPALAGVMLLLLLGIGPWNLMALPNHDQGRRLSLLLNDSDPAGSVTTPDWDDAQAADARGAIQYLNEGDHGRAVLARVLLDHGVVYDVMDRDTNALMAKLGHPLKATPEREQFLTAQRDLKVSVDVSATPYFLHHWEAFYSSGVVPGVAVRLDGGTMVVRDGDDVVLRRDLADWIGRRSNVLSEPWIDFAVGTRNYRYVVTTATWRDDGSGSLEVTNLSGELFSDQPDQATPMP